MNRQLQRFRVILDAPSLLQRIGNSVRTTAHVLWSATFAFFTEEALIRASSLAFTTLISIVPLLTVGLHVMNFYGVSTTTRLEMEIMLARYLLPTQSGAIVTLVANTASEVTQNVGVLGLLGFCVTLVLMARELEGHVLKICNKKATWWTSALHYLAFVALAPTGVIGAFLLLHPLAPILEFLPAGLSHVNYPFLLSELVVILILRTFSDYSLSWRACTFGALAVGIVAGAAWKVCALYFALSASVSAYGALSCVPAFMLWVFVAWCCMLFGAQVAAKAQKALDQKSKPALLLQKELS
jgi:membrane protein